MFMIIFIISSVLTVGAIIEDSQEFTLNGVVFYRKSKTCDTVERCMEKYKP